MEDKKEEKNGRWDGVKRENGNNAERNHKLGSDGCCKMPYVTS